MQALWEHKQLQTEQIVVTTSNAGVSKIEFIEFRSKTVKGGFKKNYKPRVETQHSDPNNSRNDMDLFVRNVSFIHPRRPFYILDVLSPGKMPKCFLHS